MIFKILDNIRKKPAGARRLYALGISMGITLVILLFWVVSYTQYVTKKASSEPPMSITSSIAQFGAKVFSGFSNMQKSLPTIGAPENPATSTDTDIEATSTDTWNQDASAGILEGGNAQGTASGTEPFGMATTSGR